MGRALASIPKRRLAGASDDEARIALRREQNYRAWQASGFYPRHRTFAEPILRGERRLLSYWDSISPSKRAALERSVERAREPGACLVLVGPRGSGKTQLACGISLVLASDAAKETADWTCRYWAWPDLVEQMRRSFHGRNEDGDAYVEACNVPLLVLDEVHEALRTDFEVRSFTRLMDIRYGATARTIVIANQTPEALAKSVGASVADRLSEIGAVLECDWPTFRKPHKN